MHWLRVLKFEERITSRSGLPQTLPNPGSKSNQLCEQVPLISIPYLLSHLTKPSHTGDYTAPLVDATNPIVMWKTQHKFNAPRLRHWGLGPPKFHHSPFFLGDNGVPMKKKERRSLSGRWNIQIPGAIVKSEYRSNDSKASPVTSWKRTFLCFHLAFPSAFCNRAIGL